MPVSNVYRSSSSINWIALGYRYQFVFYFRDEGMLFMTTRATFGFQRNLCDPWLIWSAVVARGSSYIQIKPYESALVAQTTIAIKSHCSATAQRCIHNPSVLSERIQLWPRGAPYKRILCLSVLTIDHRDDLRAFVKSATDFIFREKSTDSAKQRFDS